MEPNLDLTANMHSFESMGAVDGPGLRCVVFLQGCHLRCKYCQNRDTWEEDRQMTKISVRDLAIKILRYKNYFEGGGGVTISGGEPLLQQDFLISLFTVLKQNGINTCLDTSGMFELDDKLKQLIDLTDVFLLDIKHIDPNKCIELVGWPNEKELAFARYLSENGKHMWIRQVLVPGITDDENDLLKLRDFVKSLETVDRFEFLPYHDLGKSKWTNLGLIYPLEGVRTANNDDVQRAYKIFNT